MRTGRPFGTEDSVKPEADSIRNAGTFLNVGDSKLVVYVPSWCSEPANIASNARKLVAVHSAKIIRPTCDSKLEGPLGSLSIHQNDDPFLNKVIGAVRKAQEQNAEVDLSKVIDSKDHRRVEFLRIAKKLHICRTSNALVVKDRRGPRAIVPESLRSTFVKRAHDLKGHCGIPRMKEHLKMLWWINMDEDCANYVRSCTSCLQTKGAHGRPQAPPAGVICKGKYPGHILCIDYVTMKSPAAGCKYLLTKSSCTGENNDRNGYSS